MQFRPTPNNILGVILAGGKSSRMGGGDKSLQTLGDISVLSHVIARMAPQSKDLILNANGDAARFYDYGLTVISDEIPGQPGPLAGILAGMCFGADKGFDWILTAPADTPFLPQNLAQSLGKNSQPSQISMAATRQEGKLQPQPVVALWPVALRFALRDFVTAGGAKVTAFARAQGCVFIDFPGSAFFNINTPQDLQKAHDLLINPSPG